MRTARDLAEQIREQLAEEWIPAIYEREILSDRTRRYALNCPQGARRVEIIHTLLGIEVKADGRRLLVPDLALARYLATFARIGVEVIAIPYDITRVSRMADRLEQAWHRLRLLVEQATEGRSVPFRSRVRSSLLQRMRAELKELGAGPLYPSFEMVRRRR